MGLPGRNGGGAIGRAAHGRTAADLRGALIAFVICLAVSAAGDQHRLQPWAYHLGLTALALATLTARDSWPLLRLLTVSIYAYSGWSKCDLTFVDTLGRQFAAVPAGWLHIDFAAWPASQQQIAAALFPGVELLIALGLAWPRTRRAALWLAVASHALLIVILGPWGLGHQPGVLLWNAFMIVQDVLLFSAVLPRLRKSTGRRPVNIGAPVPATRTLGGRITVAIFYLAVLAPLLEPWGWCDHWLAWGLYAPRSERVRIFVRPSQARRLPNEVQDHLVPLRDGRQWLELRVDRWSLAELGAPIYPQNRFQLAVAGSLAMQRQLGDGIQVILYGAADRRSGQREREELRGAGEIDAGCDRYWLNGRPD